MTKIWATVLLSIAVFQPLSAEEVEKSDSGLGKFGFGLGIGVTALDREEIRDAVIENGIVRITDEEDVSRAIWLETHYTWDGWAQEKWKRTHTAPGVFFAVQASDDDSLFDAVAFGGLISFKRTRLSDKSNKLAFNIGLGIANKKIQVLGDGFAANEAIPDGVEGIRYKEIDETGPVLMFSFSVF